MMAMRSGPGRGVGSGMEGSARLRDELGDEADFHAGRPGAGPGFEEVAFGFIAAASEFDGIGSVADAAVGVAEDDCLVRLELPFDGRAKTNQGFAIEAHEGKLRVKPEGLDVMIDSG